MNSYAATENRTNCPEEDVGPEINLILKQTINGVPING
jgi:hypothetical protein